MWKNKKLYIYFNFFSCMFSKKDVKGDQSNYMFVIEQNIITRRGKILNYT